MTFDFFDLLQKTERFILGLYLVPERKTPLLFYGSQLTLAQCAAGYMSQQPVQHIFHLLMPISYFSPSCNLWIFLQELVCNVKPFAGTIPQQIVIGWKVNIAFYNKAICLYV
jgi:hypothetical protein